MVSAPRSKSPPRIQEQGRRNLWSAPIIIRVMCGATRQTKPIIPVKQMIPAVIKVASAIQTVLTLRVFTPRVVATSSPATRAFKSQEYFIKKGRQQAKIIETTTMLGSGNILQQ